jgi:hypothetical protein
MSQLSTIALTVTSGMCCDQLPTHNEVRGTRVQSTSSREAKQLSPPERPHTIGRIGSSGSHGNTSSAVVMCASVKVLARVSQSPASRDRPDRVQF